MWLIQALSIKTKPKSLSIKHNGYPALGTYIVILLKYQSYGLPLYL